MSRRSQDKRRAARKAQAKERRRMQGRSPLSKLGRLEETRCYIRGGKTDEMASLLAARPLRDGGQILAAFLIDYQCLGIKDAWYRKEPDFAGLRDRWGEPIPLAEVRALVAAGIKWNRDYNFKLPPDTERMLPVLGDPLDIEHADTRDFGAPGGGLHYVGYREDLERLLRDETVGEFMKRPGVNVTFMLQDGLSLVSDDGEFSEDEEPITDDDLRKAEAAEFLDGLIEKLTEVLMTKVRQWYFIKQRIAEPALADACAIFAEALLTIEEGDTAATEAFLTTRVAAAPPEKQGSLLRAIEDVQLCVASMGEDGIAELVEQFRG